jgi:hypothetical protein
LGGKSVHCKECSYEGTTQKDMDKPVNPVYEWPILWTMWPLGSDCFINNGIIRRGIELKMEGMEAIMD